MKLINRQASLLAVALLGSISSASAISDTVADYDEQIVNMNMIQTYFTNHSLGYIGFVADIAAAWNSDEGGVIDEFRLQIGVSAFVAGNLVTGYGTSGNYDPSGGATVGPNITFTVASKAWGEISDPAYATSLDYSMYLKPDSQGAKISATTDSGVSLTEIGFTVNERTADKVVALVYFSDNTSYTETLRAALGSEGNCFFGAVAPAGTTISYFTLKALNGNTIYLDDLAFSTITPTPEPSTLGLAALGLGLILRRRRN
jgi:PEP-CTERM motif